VQESTPFPFRWPIKSWPAPNGIAWFEQPVPGEISPRSDKTIPFQGLFWITDFTGFALPEELKKPQACFFSFPFPFLKEFEKAGPTAGDSLVVAPVPLPLSHSEDIHLRMQNQLADVLEAFAIFADPQAQQQATVSTDITVERGLLPLDQTPEQSQASRDLLTDVQTTIHIVDAAPIIVRFLQNPQGLFKLDDDDDAAPKHMHWRRGYWNLVDHRLQYVNPHLAPGVGGE
jgi:hypothetical protein